MHTYVVDPPEVWEADPELITEAAPDVVYVSALNEGDAVLIYESFRDCDDNTAVLMTRTFLVNGTPDDAREAVASCATPGIRAYRIRGTV